MRYVTGRAPKLRVSRETNDALSQADERKAELGGDRSYSEPLGCMAFRSRLPSRLHLGRCQMVTTTLPRFGQASVPSQSASPVRYDGQKRAMPGYFSWSTSPCWTRMTGALWPELDDGVAYLVGLSRKRLSCNDRQFVHSSPGRRGQLRLAQ